MTTKTYCDKCKKIIKDEDNWLKVSMTLRLLPKDTYGLKSSYNNWHLCANCAKKIAPKFIDILKK